MELISRGLILAFCGLLFGAPRGERGSVRSVRLPSVAGRFYPAGAEALRGEVEGYISGAEKVDLPGPLLALIVPHAGYAFSGPVAGWAYRQLEGMRIDDVVLIGGHSGRLPYAAVFTGGAYRTPLGDMAVDAGLARTLVASGDAFRDDGKPHETADHPLEVQVPFLQVALPEAGLVPVYFNRVDRSLDRSVGEGMARALKGRRAVILCSTDLSHYPDAEAAEEADRAILEAICSMDVETILREDGRLLRRFAGRGEQCTACGLGAVLATVEAVRAMGAAGARILKYEHSGDRPMGGRDRVVGYGAVAFYGERRSGPHPEEAGR